MVTVTNCRAPCKLLKDAGLWVVGADAEAPQTRRRDRPDRAHGAGHGRRGAGCGPLTRRHCDWLVRLPSCGAVESLNVSVAAGMLLYEAVRQRERRIARLSDARARPESVAGRSSVDCEQRAVCAARVPFLYDFPRPYVAGSPCRTAPLPSLRAALPTRRIMRHYEIVFLVHPDQSEQVPAMIERYKGMIAAGNGTRASPRGLGPPPARLSRSPRSTRRTTCCSTSRATRRRSNELTGAFRFSDAVLRHLVVERGHGRHRALADGASAEEEGEAPARRDARR